MSTKINVNVLHTLRESTQRNRALVAVLNAVKDSEYTEHINVINSEAQLNAVYPEALSLAPSEKPTPTQLQAEADALFELNQIRYLLDSGVSVVCLSTSVATLVADLTTGLEDNKDNFNIKVITIPVPAAADLEAVAKLVKTGDVELHITTTDKKYDKTNFLANRNVSVFFGKGRYSGGDPRYILAGVMAQARKILNREKGIPYQPIAGETHGVFLDFIDVEERLSRKERNTLQENNVNPLILKIGVGVHFVAQRTRYSTNTKETFAKAHANTLTNYLIDALEDIGDKYHFTPNNQTTWDLLNMDIKSLLRTVSAGITDSAVITGRRVMSAEDIANGILKAKVVFVPIEVSEEVEFNLVIQDSGDILVNVEETQPEEVGGEE